MYDYGLPMQTWFSNNTVITKILVDCSVCEGKGVTAFTGASNSSGNSYILCPVKCVMCNGLGKVQIE